MDKKKTIKVQATGFFNASRFASMPTNMISKAEFDRLRSGEIIEIEAERLTIQHQFYLEEVTDGNSKDSKRKVG